MKKIVFLVSLFSLLAVFSIPVAAQCDAGLESPIRCGYYNEGFMDGVGDANSNRNRDYKRYRSKYESKYESVYRDAYNAGYDSVRPTFQWTSSQRSAYDSGYTIGQNDRRSNRPRSREDGNRPYDQNITLYFQQGYNDGFSNLPRTYNVQVSGTNPIYPVPPVVQPPWGGGAGTATGNGSWSGRVDDRGNILIRGNQVWVENVSGNGTTTTYQNMNGVLPRRASNFTARRSDGRGSVNVVQQPSRENNFTAIIQVYDSGSGSDNYRIDFSWVAAQMVEEPYSAGSVRWRGRVDQTAHIMISGSDVQSRDVTMTGLSNVNFSINGYLANRPGSVTVRKRSGRGTVTVLQQPSNMNDYVAIVQIFDPNGGAGDYELDISW